MYVIAFVVAVCVFYIFELIHGTSICFILFYASLDSHMWEGPSFGITCNFVLCFCSCIEMAAKDTFRD